MKPMTISAMVAGVQAGRIRAVVFIFSRSFDYGSQTGCTGFEMVGAKPRFKTSPSKTGQVI